MATDRDLWELVKGGNTEAFAAVYRRHGDRVFSHCLQRGVGQHDAEEITAEVFTIAWRRRDAVRVLDDAGALPWLLVTANNLLRSRRRAVGQRLRLLAKIPWEHSTPDIAEAITDQAGDDASLQLLMQVLRRMKTRDQEVIQMCVVQGISPAAVALAAKVPASTIRARLHRALAAARIEYDRLIAQQDSTPGEGT